MVCVWAKGDPAEALLNSLSTERGRGFPALLVKTSLCWNHLSSQSYYSPRRLRNQWGGLYTAFSLTESISAGFPCHWSEDPVRGALHPPPGLPLLVLKAHSDANPRMLQSFKATQLVMDKAFLNPFLALHLHLLGLRVTLLKRRPGKRSIILKRIPQWDFQLAPTQSHRECVRKGYY